jgi:ABC-type amino acid transport substrate-binding protein
MTSPTIQRIRARGHLRAGVSQGIRGLSYRDDDDPCWRGFDVELARAVAIAVTGDADAIEFVPIAPHARSAAVGSGDVDIGTFNASATLGRELEHDVVFPQAMLYDGEALMLRADLVGSGGVKDLLRRVVAVQQGATSSANLQRFFGAAGMTHELRVYATPDDARRAYELGECNLYALDRIQLTGERLRLARPHEHVILDEQISKEAMGPVVATADPAWVRAVTWVMRVLIEAEQLGLGSVNCQTIHKRREPQLQEFLAPTAARCERLGLIERFPLRILQRVGNYAEVYARTLGNASELKLPRLHNMLWRDGGLLISPSFD